MKKGAVRQSTWDANLVENPEGKRKFSSIFITLDPLKQITVRQTYGLLDYFGDIGGLIDFFYFFVTFILTPVWQFVYSSHMLTSLFRAESN